MKITYAAVVLLFVACNTASNKEESKQPANTDTTMSVKQETVKYTITMVDNKKDPSCGMPVQGGIDDTIHYNNKVIGFCSKDCKDAFMKDAAKNVAAVEWKK